MRVTHLWLSDFRSYVEAELQPAGGLTVVVGDNGQGKTNLLEALAYLATLSSFRGAPSEAMVRSGCERAVVRAEAEREGRALLLEAEVGLTGRERVQVNRQPLRRSRDLLGALRVTVFSPDDLTLVKGGPAERRRYLDDALVALHPRNDALRADVDRVLRQRNTLLKQVAAAGRRLDADAATTLDVWDAKLAEAGEALGAARAALVDRLAPLVAAAYDEVASGPADVGVSYEAPWRAGGLAAALLAARPDELRRGVSLVGPHRDDVALSIGAMPARTHASQGEQRSLALALRLASHAVVAEDTGTPPVLLLDDVFSELDHGRSEALLAHLPPGQALLTTAGDVPPSADVELTVRIENGKVLS